MLHLSRTHDLLLVPFLGSHPLVQEPPEYDMTACFPRKGASPLHGPQCPSHCPSRSGSGPGLYRLPLGGWDGTDRGLPGPLCEVSKEVRSVGDELGSLHARNATVQQDSRLGPLKIDGRVFLKGTVGRGPRRLS